MNCLLNNLQAANIISSSIQPLQNLAVLVSFFGENPSFFVSLVMLFVKYYTFAAIVHQKYIEEKVGPHEKLPWVQSHIIRGFIGKFWHKQNKINMYRDLLTFTFLYSIIMYHIRIVCIFVFLMLLFFQLLRNYWKVILGNMPQEMM